MNNLLTHSFEMGRHQPRQQVIEVDDGSSATNMDAFFKQVGDIDAQIVEITTHLRKLQIANGETHSVTKASAMKEIKLRMEKEIEEVVMVALKVKKSLEALDKDNFTNRQKPGCGSGTSIDRSRMVMTTTLKKKLKERMNEFQVLRQTIHDEYREAVERRVYTVTGIRPDEETIDNLIETGDSEQIFAQAIQGYGRGQIRDTVAEIQERCDTAKEIERKLYELQQLFMDLSVLVESQGDLLNDIEAQVSSAVDHVQAGTKILQKAKKLNRNTRAYMCIAVIILLIIIVIALTAVFKELIPWQKKN